MKVTPSIDDDVKGPFIVRKLPKYSIEKAAASWRRSPKSRFYYIILHTKKTCKIDPSVSVLKVFCKIDELGYAFHKIGSRSARK